MTIAVVVGSLRQGSYNKKLAELAMQQTAKGQSYRLVDISQLPIFNEDLESNVPSAVVEFKQALVDADGILIVTPEYNRSIPAALKNAIDWASRPDGQSVWTGKPVGIMGASTGQFGTITAQFDVRRVLGYCGALVMPQPQALVTKVEKKLDSGAFDEATIKVVGKYMNKLADWIAQF